MSGIRHSLTSLTARLVTAALLPLGALAAAPATLYPDFGSATAPIRGRLQAAAAEAGQVNTGTHPLRLPPGVWVIRLRSGAFAPQLELRDGDAVVASENYEPRRGDGVAVTVTVPAAGTYDLRVSGARADDAGDYLVTVSPATPPSAGEPIAALDVELRPALAYPQSDGEHSAAPVCVMMEAGVSYRVKARCENGRTWLLMPAQHGLLRRLSTYAPEAKGDDARLDFIAPRSGLYVFWCLAQERDFRTRARVTAEACELGTGLPGPGAKAMLSRRSARELILWKRHAFHLDPGDPEVAVTCPPRAKLKVEVAAGAAGAAAYDLVIGGHLTPLRAPAGGSASETLLLPEGASGLKIRAAAGHEAPALLTVSTELPRDVGALGGQAHIRECALPAVLRAKVKAGTHIAAAVRGGGVSPQLVIRGAGVLAACADPNGRSPLAATEGVTTRDGIVEVLVAAGGAEQGAFASCAFKGFDPQPEGRGAELDLPDLALLSAPGKAVLRQRGALSDGSPKLTDGARVNWFRVPVKAGRIYRVLADAEFAPDLVLDVPGEGKRLAPCGIALLHPTADGEATLGLAAPGANLAGDFALLVSDIGPATPAAPANIKTK